ncbi:hypothetical protein [Cryobacterium psychrophilum]|uniref:hypothetical protein n=1 Tax=Cryobacterium psychrophilum TaxID=41988 RepID=UPI003BAF65E3
MLLREHDAIRREHRVRAQDPLFQADYRQHRPMVERSIAWMTRKSRRCHPPGAPCPGSGP